MNLKSFGFMTAGAIMVATAANANPIYDIYGGLTVGAGGATVFAPHDTDTNAGMTLGALVGIDIPAFRFEGEYNYLNSSDFDMHIGMVNAYFKMPSTVIHPYLGVGVGMAFSGEYDLDVGHADIGTSAAYQGMLGVTMDLPALPIKFDVEGRALYAPDAFKIGNDKPDILYYDLRLKLRYVF